MANYVSNVLQVSGEFQAILASINDGTDLITFNKIIPIPDNVEDVVWWMTDNWGTNGTGQLIKAKPKKRTIKFWTKWTAPLPAIEELSRRFPTVTFNLTYANEDYGSDLGQLEYKNGVQTDWYHPNTESEIKEMFDICWKSK